MAGDRWRSCAGATATTRREGPPRLIRHRGCGGKVTERLRCDRCGADLELRDVEAVFGPGARHHREGEPVDGRPAAA